jgi:hypothetical protein
LTFSGPRGSMQSAPNSASHVPLDRLGSRPTETTVATLNVTPLIEDTRPCPPYHRSASAQAANCDFVDIIGRSITSHRKSTSGRSTKLAHFCRVICRQSHYRDHPSPLLVKPTALPAAPARAVDVCRHPPRRIAQRTRASIRPSIATNAREHRR